MKPFVAIIIGLAILAGAVAFVLTRPEDTEDTTNTNPTSNTKTNTEQTSQTDEAPAESVTITYTDGGFSPETYKVKAGGSVTVQNNSDDVLDFASDDHPAHRDNSELNAGNIPAGESQTFTLNKTGVWGFHNHLRDAHTGSITVE